MIAGKRARRGLAWLSVLLASTAQAPLAQTRSIFAERELPVAVSPAEATSLLLAPGQKVIDFDVWSTGPEAAVVVRDPAGATRLVGWRVGDTTTTTLGLLPAGLDVRAIACHPARREIFVSGRRGGKSVILSFTPLGQAWRMRVVFETTRDLRRLLVSPRPFATDSGVRYRLFFAARLADGSFSTRTITDHGRIEYQAIGPKSAIVKIHSADNTELASEVTAPSAMPAAFHPAGHILIWQDARGCFHQLPYGVSSWQTPEAQAGKSAAGIPGDPCGGSLTVTPNGTGLLHWRRDQPGVALVLDHGRTTTQQATTYTFLSTPSSVPDGRGVIGVVARDGGTSLVYAPISVPLADVVNAWMFLESADDLVRFEQKAGLFRSQGVREQLFQLYDTESYAACGGYSAAIPSRPYLVTTDVLWEVFGAAYEGAFIIQERRQAIPAFWAFVTSANGALRTASPGSAWARVFAALAEARGAASTGEAARIAGSTIREASSALGAEFDFGELKARGHYTSSPEMERYFRAVHYLTQIGRELRAAPLGALPADVRQKALTWIAVYTPYIAPSRAPLVWTGQSAVPAYARHPTTDPAVFPLSWGFDNEIILSTIYHSDWPPAEQITGSNGARLLPSGVDVAAGIGSAFARSLLEPALREYPTLGPVLDGLVARYPRGKPASNLYDQWMAALAVQWADSATFPGMRVAESVWPAKRLQTGLASWTTLRHTTVLVNERGNAECGEGGFEELVLRPPRGYVEPDPKTFEAIAGLFDRLAQHVAASNDLKSDTGHVDQDPLQQGILRRLRESAGKARLFRAIADKELRGQPLTDGEYEEILNVGRVAEHQFLVFKSLTNKDLALANPDPMMKVVDVASAPGSVLLSAVGRPLEWDQMVPFFGRRAIVKGSVYSYHEFASPSPLNNDEWRKRVDQQARPSWIASLLSSLVLSCPAIAPF